MTSGNVANDPAISIWGSPAFTVGPRYWIIEHNRITSNASSAYGAEGCGVGFTGTGRLENNVIIGNTATGYNYSTGAVNVWASPGPQDILIRDNIIKDNFGGLGSAIFMSGYIFGTDNFIPQVTLANNIIVGNGNASSGTIYAWSGYYRFVNNTIANNRDSHTIHLRDTRGPLSASFLNNIIWNPLTAAEFYDGGYATLAYNCIREGSGGTGTIWSDPLFVPGDSLYRLSPTSPCIDAGATDAMLGVTLTAPTTDYLGMVRPRPIGSRPDMGAIENDAGRAIRRVPQDYAKIQQAINASTNGDVVLVSEGTYTENLVIRKKITVASLYHEDGNTSHISRTIVSGSNPSHPDTGAVISIYQGADSSTVIEGLTITGGTGNYLPSFWGYVSRVGGGISIWSAGATIRHNHITNNIVQAPPSQFAWGGGISAGPFAWPTPNEYTIIESNTLSGNRVNGDTTEGGAIAFWNADGRIVNNIVQDNQAAYVGGISVYAVAALDTSEVLIQSNLVKSNTAGKNVGGIGYYGSGMRGVIRNNVITDNRGLNSNGSLSIGDTCDVLVESNYIARNTGGAIGGINIYRINRTITLANNIIAENSGYGVRLSGSNLGHIVRTKLINNTIVGNGSYGTYAGWPSIAFGLNNVISNNAFGSYSGDGDFYFQNCLIQGGFPGTGIISTSPGFVANDTLYRLGTGSAALGAGVLSALVGGLNLTAPTLDFLGAPRPQPDTTRPDLGAIEHYLWDPNTGVEESPEFLPTEFALLQNYPNPFNPGTKIGYRMKERGWVKVAVHDLLGRQVAILVDEEQPAGNYAATWNASEVPSGVYFCTMTAGSFTRTVRMVLLR